MIPSMLQAEGGSVKRDRKVMGKNKKIKSILAATAKKKKEIVWGK